MELGRKYRLPLAVTSVSAALDLVEVLTGSGHICVIDVISLSQWSELGDAQEEMLKIAFKTGQTTSGSGGNTGVTPIPRLIGDAAHGMTVESFNTTKASAGTIVEHGLWQWNVREEKEKIFLPKYPIVIPPSTRGTLELVDAPADAISIGGEILLTVIG